MKQPTVAMFTCEAEFMSLATATREGKFLQALMKDMQVCPLENSTFYCDNQGAMALSQNPDQRQRSKCINIKYYFARDDIQSDSLEVIYVPSEQNVVGIFTKPVSRLKGEKFSALLMGN